MHLGLRNCETFDVVSGPACIYSSSTCVGIGGKHLFVACFPLQVNLRENYSTAISGAFSSQRVVCTLASGQPQVGQNKLAVPPVVEDIARLDVTVNNITVVKEHQSVPYPGEFALARGEGGR